MRFVRTALVAASAAGVFCLGCFGASPENGKETPRTVCDAKTNPTANETSFAEFPAAPPGALDRERLARAEWVVAPPFTYPVLPKSRDEGDVTIFGQAEVTERQMADYILLRNPAPSLACSVEELVALYYEEAGREGIRADIALCQACKETGFFRYGGDVTPDQNNYCGLGATGNHEPGARFPSPAMGVRAHIQHLLVYATERRPETEIVDPRYELVVERRPDIHGRVLTWTDLGGTWCVPGTYYGQDILNLWRQAKAVDDPQATQPGVSGAEGRDPDSADAYIRRGSIRYYAGEAELAVSEYDRAIFFAPSAEAYYDRALAYEAMGDGSRAEEDYTKATILNPKLPQTWYNRGRLRLLNDDYPRALADFSRALALIPQMADAKVAIGVAHAKQGDYEAAWHDFFEVTDTIHDNNEAALANQKIMMDAVVRETARK